MYAVAKEFITLLYLTESYHCDIRIGTQSSFDKQPLDFTCADLKRQIVITPDTPLKNVHVLGVTQKGSSS